MLTGHAGSHGKKQLTYASLKLHINQNRVGSAMHVYACCLDKCSIHLYASCVLLLRVFFFIQLMHLLSSSKQPLAWAGTRPPNNRAMARLGPGPLRTHKILWWFYEFVGMVHLPALQAAEAARIWIFLERLLSASAVLWHASLWFTIVWILDHQFTHPASQLVPNPQS